MPSWIELVLNLKKIQRNKGQNKNSSVFIFASAFLQQPREAQIFIQHQT